MIISTIIFFHLLPFILNKKFLNGLVKSLKTNFFYIIPLFLVNIIFFNYKNDFTGGGVFFQLSYYLTKNNFIFYFACFVSFCTMAYFIKSSYVNLIIFSILILSNIQNTIYHKYFDPLILILFFTIINHHSIKDFLNKKFNLVYLYLFYLTYILLRFVKNTFFLY